MRRARPSSRCASRSTTGRIVLIGDEPYLPYQRPPLSKKFLAGELAAERLYLKPVSFYDDPQIDVRLNTLITAIDVNSKALSLASGDVVAYDRLILALGSRVRQLQVDGNDLRHVHYLRSIADVEGIRQDFDPGKRLVVIGAGYIGLEVAAVARQLGLDVTVIEMADRVMSRVVSPEISDFYQIEHTSHGVRLRLSTSVTALRGRKRAKHVVTGDGEEIPADLVVIGVGILPNTELAEQAGLDVGDGIIVDDRCMTSNPGHLCHRRLHLASQLDLRPSAAPGVGAQCGGTGKDRRQQPLWQRVALLAGAVVLV